MVGKGSFVAFRSFVLHGRVGFGMSVNILGEYAISESSLKPDKNTLFQILGFAAGGTDIAKQMVTIDLTGR